MSSLQVESPGLLTTVQDLGRAGHGPLGVSPSGAADPVALRLGNMLVGNEPGAAALELTLTGGTYSFPEGAVIALTGADFAATVGGRAVELWTPHALQPGARLILGGSRNFARGYLAVAGGVQVEPFLGSASTHLLSGLGGFQGRALRKGDVLTLGSPSRKIRKQRISKSVLQVWQPTKVLRVTDGPQNKEFAAKARQEFFRSTFQVTEDSDRMGLRLNGPVVTVKSGGKMITEGTPLGAVQVLPSGRPVILFVEQQTTGGYPKIANVIGADLHRVGQLRPRDEIRFERVTMREARRLWIEQQRSLNDPERLFAQNGSTNHAH